MAFNSDQFVRYFNESAIQGFVGSFPALGAITKQIVHEDVALNSVVRVPYVDTVNTASATFSYSTGYASNTVYTTAKSVTVSNLLYEKWTVTDQDFAQLGNEVIANMGKGIGAKLAAKVSNTIWSSVVGSFTSSSYTSGQFTSSVAAISLMNGAAKWLGESSIVMTPGLKGNILQNTNVANNSVFGGKLASEGTLSGYKFYGFQPYDSYTLGTAGCSGIALAPSAVLFVNGYHAPQTTDGLIVAGRMTDPKTGIVLGFRSIPDQAKATVTHVVDCLFGAAVGDSAAAYVIPA